MNASLAQAAPAIIPRAFAVPTLAALFQDEIGAAMKASKTKVSYAGAQRGPDNFTPLRQDILRSLEESPKTVYQLAMETGAELNTVQAALTKMLAMGFVKKQGKIPDHRYRPVNLWARVAA